jgi:hypothetical protein
MKPGRPSAASLTVVPIDASRTRPKLIPLKRLNIRQRQTFNLVCAENPHLRPTDAPLVTAYSLVVARFLSVSDVGDMEKLSRTIMALARTLRLTPQSRCDPKTVGRARPVNNKYAWDRAEPDDDDEAG